MRFYRPFSEGPFWSDRRRLNTGVINGPVPTRWARAQTNGWGALNGAIVLSITSVFTPLTCHSGLCEKSRSLKNIHACSMLTKTLLENEKQAAEKKHSDKASMKLHEKSERNKNTGWCQDPKDQHWLKHFATITNR